MPAHGPIGGIETLERNIHYLRGLLDGHPVKVSGPLTDFYRRTHEANQRGRGLDPYARVPRSYARASMMAFSVGLGRIAFAVFTGSGW